MLAEIATNTTAYHFIDKGQRMPPSNVVCDDQVNTRGGRKVGFDFPQKIAAQ